MTNDIAIGLRTNLAAAEQLKMQLRLTREPRAPILRTDEPRSMIIDDGVARPAARKADVTEIMDARMRELFEKIGEDIAANGDVHRLPAGLVLTGGGSLLAGAADLGREVLGMPVRVAAPEGIGGLTDHLLTPTYSTGIGLLMWAAQVVTLQDAERYEPVPADDRWSRVQDVLRRIFP